MYHPNLFKEKTNSWPTWHVAYQPMWAAAVLGKEKVTLEYRTKSEADDTAAYFNRMRLQRVQIMGIPHKSGKASYEVTGYFDVGMNDSLAIEWGDAVARNARRIKEYGNNAPNDILYRMLDELHVAIQLAVNTPDKTYVVLDTPSPNKFDEPFPADVAKMLRDKIKELTPSCQCKLVGVTCYLWDEQSFILWNWDGNHRELGAIDKYYHDIEDIPL